jgi:D-alanyl-D-alanine carboxypeptidase
MRTSVSSQLLIIVVALGSCSATSIFINAYGSETTLSSIERGNFVRSTMLIREFMEQDNRDAAKNRNLNAANDVNLSNDLQGAKLNSYGAPASDIKGQIDRLVLAYPGAIDRHDGEMLFMKNGTRFQISDNKTDKTFDELLAKPDIDDMFYVPYPAGTVPAQPAQNSDPGRVRFEPLFTAMYGDCTKHEVTKNLRTIAWLPKHDGGNVTITTVNGVDVALEAASRELDELPDTLVKYLKPSAGTYNCRPIAGTHNRSMHAYAAAIDINTKYSDYWRWGSGGKAEPRWRNQIPIEIIRIFEKHSFIWGGYWYHYDTMHFEYRPELFSSKGSND